MHRPWQVVKRPHVHPHSSEVMKQMSWNCWNKKHKENISKIFEEIDWAFYKVPQPEKIIEQYEEVKKKWL
jgi:hypothetical protein